MDCWVVKTNSLGVVEWDKTIGGASPSGNEQDFFSVTKKQLIMAIPSVVIQIRLYSVIKQKNRLVVRIIG